MVHTFYPSTLKSEVGRSLSSRLVWFTEWVLGYPGLHGETLSQNEIEKKRGRREERGRKGGKKEGRKANEFWTLCMKKLQCINLSNSVFLRELNVTSAQELRLDRPAWCTSGLTHSSSVLSSFQLSADGPLRALLKFEMLTSSLSWTLNSNSCFHSCIRI